MSVAGQVVTYTLDYASGGRVLLEEGGAFSDTKHYLYGLECIAELVDADEPESEWRYYHQDGNHLVRQTTNEQAEVTFAWTFSPEGAVVLGEKGPVTNLGCGGIYDFSTGLIFKNGKYFDPNSGIWLTMSGLVIYQGRWLPYGRRRKWGKGKNSLCFLCLLLFLALTLTGCGIGGDPAQAPVSTPCPTKTLPPPQIGDPKISSPRILFFGGSYVGRITEQGPLPSEQTPRYADFASEVVRYPGSKQVQADAANKYDEDLLIIGYSSGADTALIYADMHMRAHPEQKGNWSIVGVALLGPTMSGTMAGGGNLDVQWERIMDELILGGTNIYWVDDDTLPESEFTNYQPPSSCIGVLNKVRRNDLMHYSDTIGKGTNNNVDLFNDILNWFGVPH